MADFISWFVVCSLHALEGSCCIVGLRPTTMVHHESLLQERDCACSNRVTWALGEISMHKLYIVLEFYTSTQQLANIPPKAAGSLCTDITSVYIIILITTHPRPKSTENAIINENPWWNGFDKNIGFLRTMHLDGESCLNNTRLRSVPILVQYTLSYLALCNKINQFAGVTQWYCDLQESIFLRFT